MSDDLHALTGAYAAGALSELERAAVDRHLTRCAPCREEIGELQATAARLGAAEAAEPPAALRQRVLESVARSRQMPPRSGAAARRATRWSALLPRLAVAAAVVALTAGLSLAGLTAHLNGRLDAARRSGDQVTEVLTASDVKLHSVASPGGIAATVAVSRMRNRAVFLATGLPSVPDSRSYELWVVDADGLHPAGLIPGGPSRPVTAVLQASSAGSNGVALTVEPRAGSPRPTTLPIVRVELPT